jgi:acetoin utilization deacetylase AcuC-like enzyme
MALPFPLVYHSGYDLNFGTHVFPTRKYRLMRERLLAEAFAEESDFVEPRAATRDQLLLAHDEEWIRKLETGTLSYHEIVQLEVPYSRKMVQAFFLAAGGTIEAARLALRHGVAINIGGGFHHAFRGHGEGFCAVNDIAVAINTMLREGVIARAMVIDLDVHHGNGTAAIFAGSRDVFTLSLHQQNNYPREKPQSTIDVGLPDLTGDHEYLAKLRGVCAPAVAGFRPDLVIYVAGSDPYFDDQLGGLALTMEGMRARDQMVFEAALRAGAGIAVVLAGGYANRLEDTVSLHSQTAYAALEAMNEIGVRRGRA